MTKQIDFTKPVRTKSGLPVRIICTDAKGTFPIIGLVSVDARETLMSYTSKGQFYKDEEDVDDLENIPETKVTYSGVYLTNNGDLDTGAVYYYHKGSVPETKHSSKLIKILELRITDGVVETILHNV